MDPRTWPRQRRVGAALLTAALLLAACVGAEDRTSPAPKPATRVGAPAEVRRDRAGWVLPGRDYDNSRATSTSRITSGNVATLTEAWSVTVKGALSTVPIISEGIVYYQDGAGVVGAVALADGRVRWRSKAYGFNIGPFGVAVADGRIVAGHGSTGLVALDARTGRELWVRDITSTPTAGVDIQPTVFGGMVFASTVPVSIDGIYQGGDRGVLHALDASTGKVRWTFDTVDSPDVWGNPKVNSGGGAWYPPSIDPRRGLIYWGVANPAPFPGTKEHPNGSSRPGPNLYTNSVVALDVATGKLDWYHQVHPHDLFDRDQVHTLIARPKAGPVVVSAGKGGVIVGLDPRSGARRWRAKVGLHRNDDLTELPGPTTVAPGTFGGVLTPPATADGVVYVPVVNAPIELRPDEVSYFGAKLGQLPGEVVAIDAVTGRIRWTRKVPGDPLGATTVVNDLVVTALLDGTVLALDRGTGKQVWSTKAPGGVNGWMAVSGDTLVVPAGNGSPPRLVAYSLPAP